MNQPLPGMPDNPEFTQDHNIPRRAGSLLHMLMDDFQRENRTPPDWRRVAVKLARTGAGFHRLTTPERDAIEAALEETGAIDADRRFVDAADAADRGADA